MPYRARPPTRVHVAARTDVGRCRVHNEDNFRVGVIGSDDVLAPVPATAESHEISAHLAAPGFVLGVYDGCGGWEAATPGSVASATAAEVVHAELCGTCAPAPADVPARLATAVEEAGRRIWAAAESDPSWRGGTTATVAVLFGRRLEVAQVGDSRAYRLDGTGLRRLTRDDTLLNNLLDKGQLSPEEAASFPHDNVITKALGLLERTVPTVTSTEVEPGDRLFLCTDGVSRSIDDGELASLLRQHREPDACCRAIVEAVYRAGAPDNLTMIVVDVLGT